MDLNDFWQENKRWLLGCVAGLLVYLIASSNIASRLSGASDWRSVVAATTEFRKEKYRGKQLTAASEDAAKLEEQFAALRSAMHYELPERFDLEGKGDPQLVWPDVYTKTREGVRGQAYDANVEFPEEAFNWTSPTDREQIQRALIGVSVVEQAVTHMIAAHRAVAGKDVEAIGLRSIGTFRLGKVISGTRSRRRDDGPTAADYLSSVEVDFQCMADTATAHRFIENVRAGVPHLSLDQLKIAGSKRPGDPLIVTGKLVALMISPLTKEDS
jgi:hypothetical protein